MAYPTLANVKTYLGGSGTGQDSVLQWLLDGAVDWVERYCGRKFVETAADTVYVVPDYPAIIGSHRRLLYLRDVDLVSVTSITNGDDESVSSGEYRLLPLEGPPYFLIELLPSSGKYWWAGGDGDGVVTIVGNTGFATTPSAVFQAVLEIVAFAFRARTSGGAGPVTTATREGLVIQPAMVPEHVLEWLRVYKRVR